MKSSLFLCSIFIATYSHVAIGAPAANKLSVTPYSNEWILQMRHEMETSKSIVDSLFANKPWPADGMLLGVVSEVKWSIKPNYSSDGSLDSMLRVSDRVGKVRIVPTSTNYEQPSRLFRLYGKFGQPPCFYDGINPNENLVIMDDDPFIEDRAFLFVHGEGEYVAGQFLQVQSVHSEWADLIKSASEFRQTRSVLFENQKLEKQHIEELVSLTTNINPIIRLLAFKKLVRVQHGEPALIEKLLRDASSVFDAAMVFSILLDESETLFFSTVTQLITSRPSYGRSSIEGAIIAVYCQAFQVRKQKATAALSQRSLPALKINLLSRNPEDPDLDNLRKLESMCEDTRDVAPETYALISRVSRALQINSKQ